MLKITKTEELAARNIPFGVVEVRYPPREEWRVDEFRAFAQGELERARESYLDYERKAVFGSDPYVRFFKKFKKTYTVMLQFESIIIKRLPFPLCDPVTEIPYLLELTTCMLSGTHDIDRIEGGVELYSGTDRTPFAGMHGRERHTYPGDFVGRDGAGIIFSEIAGADDRTCARPDSSHVFYPVFGTPDMDRNLISSAVDKLVSYVRILAPNAEIETDII